MDIGTQSEVVLRESGYETWPWTGTSPPVICFESATVVGFLHVFGSARELLDTWEAAQQRVLARHAPALRAAGAKAWNVYSVFLTSELAPTLQRQVEKLEENFALTRKIARTAIQTMEDVTNVLMPLGPIKAQPLLENADIADRLRARAKDVPVEALNAFLGDLRPVKRTAASRLNDWLRVMDGSHHFIFLIDQVPVRFYRGFAEELTVRTLRCQEAEPLQLGLALGMDEAEGLVFRLAIETGVTGVTGNVERVVFLVKQHRILTPVGFQE